MYVATHAALDTTELLEAILVHVDMRTLLLSQRVSKTFEATIDGSLALQQTLNFKPSPLVSTGSNGSIRVDSLGFVLKD